MFFSKVTRNDVRSVLGAAEVGPNLPHHFFQIEGTLTANCIGLDILIEKLVRIQFGTVGGQEEHTDAVGVAIQPALEFAGAMDGMAIYDEEHLAFRMPQQAAKETDHHLGREALLEHHERQLAPVGDGGHHVTTKALTCAWNDRRMTALPVRATRLMVGAKPHLIPPMNFRLFSLRFGTDTGVLGLQPAAHSFGVLLVGTMQRLLWRQIPPLEITAHRPYRDVDAKALRQQLLNSLPRPQREGQSQLVGTPVGDEANRSRRLVRSQTKRGWPTAAPPLEPPRPPLAKPFDPAVDRNARYMEHSRRFALTYIVLQDCPHHPTAEVFLRFRRK